MNELLCNLPTSYDDFFVIIAKHVALESYNTVTYDMILIGWPSTGYFD